MQNVFQRRADLLSSINSSGHKMSDHELPATEFKAELAGNGGIYETGVLPIVRIGFTPAAIEKAMKALMHPKFAYCKRQTKWNISVYAYDDTMPHGVKCIGGVPNELEFLINMIGRTYVSPASAVRC